MTLDMYKNRLENDYYAVTRYRKDIWKDTHVVDEDLSVKENKRLVAEHNDEEERKYKENLKEQNKKYKEKNDDFVNAIRDYMTHDLDDTKIKKLIDYIEENINGDYVSDYISSVYDILDLIDHMME